MKTSTKLWIIGLFLLFSAAAFLIVDAVVYTLQPVVSPESLPTQ